MTLPKDAEVQRAILTVIVEMGGESRPRDVFPRVTKLFPQLTPADLSRTVKTGDNAWTNFIRFARQHLVQAGDLDKSIYGIWRITDKGRQRIGVGGPPPAATHQQIVSIVQESGRQPPATTHEQIVNMVREIGERLGRFVSTSEGPEYKADVVWRKSRYQAPTEAIEVCDRGGSLEKDILSLQWATDPANWGAVGLLVMADEKELARARKRRGQPSKIFLLSGDLVRQIHAMATSENIPLLQAIFNK